MTRQSLASHQRHSRIARIIESDTDLAAAEGRLQSQLSPRQWQRIAERAAAIEDRNARLSYYWRAENELARHREILDAAAVVVHFGGGQVSARLADGEIEHLRVAWNLLSELATAAGWRVAAATLRRAA